LIEELSKTKEREIIISTVSNPLVRLEPLKSLVRRFLSLRLRLFLLNWISLWSKFNQYYLVSPSEKKMEFRLSRLCSKKQSRNSL